MHTIKHCIVLKRKELLAYATAYVEMKEQYVKCNEPATKVQIHKAIRQEEQ